MSHRVLINLFVSVAVAFAALMIVTAAVNARAALSLVQPRVDVPSITAVLAKTPTSSLALPRVITTVQLPLGFNDDPKVIGVNPNTGYIYAADLHVCPVGCAFTSIQDAVDAASDGDIIKIAEGTYTGVSARAGVTQVAYISKTITLQGGYTTTNWTTPFPITQPAILDAQGKGRVLYIIGNISPAIEGLHITGGSTFPIRSMFGDPGGGIYLINAKATIRDNWIFNNAATGLGGGLSLNNGAVTLSGNSIISNYGWDGGGGVMAVQSTVTLTSNTIASNGSSEGGGIFLLLVDAGMLSGNTVISNSAPWGGGLYMFRSAATLVNNMVLNNRADRGSGVLIRSSPSTRMLHTTIARNMGGDGSGVHIMADDIYRQQHRGLDQYHSGQPNSRHHCDSRQHSHAQ